METKTNPGYPKYVLGRCTNQAKKRHRVEIKTDMIDRNPKWSLRLSGARPRICFWYSWIR